MDRFLRYVRVNTQSSETRAGATPSTQGQWDLARMLVDELRAMGVQDVRLSDACMVYATVPATTAPGKRRVPTVGFIAHVDTSPAVSGAGVQPVVHRNYPGGDIELPGDPTQVITVAQYPELREMIGDDVITTDGTTLLGSDDKAGVAAIMTMVDTLLQNPELVHGRIAVGFTSDEEIGTGIDSFDIHAFGAEVAYTVDGGGVGEINEETWSARLATVTFRGKSAHPGTAKGVMVNSIYAMAHFVSRMPADMLPETTEGRVGFVHPYAGVADVEESNLKVLLRDFDEEQLLAKERLLRDIAVETEGLYPGVRIEMAVAENYRNMRDVLVNHPGLMANAFEAARRAGLSPFTSPIRGGTDGSRLTFRGLPCPNIFTGGFGFHSRLEFNSRLGLEKTTETLVHLTRIFAEQAGAA